MISGIASYGNVVWKMAYAGAAGLFKEQLAKSVKLSTQQLGGVLSGIVKNAKKIGGGPILLVEKTQHALSRSCRYRVPPEFAEYFKQTTTREDDHHSTDLADEQAKAEREERI